MRKHIFPFWEFDEMLIDRCCVCGKEHGLVWNAPGHRGKWVHVECMNPQLPAPGRREL
jgi:hypothetical protein